MDIKILTVDNEEDLKILKSVSEPVENINEVQELINSLKETFNASESSLGIAAPQLGENKMVFVMANPYNVKELTVCINPEITKIYDNKIGLYKEGCMSLPEEHALTRRYKMLKVAYTNEEGKRVKKLLKDLEAVVFQHELDHLFGILMSDKNLAKTKAKNESEEIINE